MAFVDHDTYYRPSGWMVTTTLDGLLHLQPAVLRLRYHRRQTIRSPPTSLTRKVRLVRKICLFFSSSVRWGW